MRNKLCHSLLVLFIFLTNCYSQEKTYKQPPLMLEKGDCFVYEKQDLFKWFSQYERSSSMKVRNSARLDIYNDDVYRSRFVFNILDVLPGNNYLLSYKVEYSNFVRQSAEQVRQRDSRFPDSDDLITDILQGYLNKVEYKVILKPQDNFIDILNMEEIHRGLKEYASSRGVEEIDIKESRISGLSSKNIIKELELLLACYLKDSLKVDWHSGENEEMSHFYSNEFETEDIIFRYNEKQISTEDRMGVASHAFTKLNKLDTSFISKESGLLLLNKTVLFNADSRLKGTDTIPPGKLYREEHVLKLAEYKRAGDSSKISGRLHMPGVEKLCLLSRASIIGSKKDFNYIDLNADSTFSISLDFTGTRTYELYLLKKHPVASNRYIPLFLHARDSIYLSVFKDTVKFSGRGYSDSEFYSQSDMKNSFSYFPYMIRPVSEISPEFIKHQEALRIKIKALRERMCKYQKTLSPEFTSFLNAELYAAAKLSDLTLFWISIQDKEYSFVSYLDEDALKIPKLPEYPDYQNLSLYQSMIAQYAYYRYLIFRMQNTGRYDGLSQYRLSLDTWHYSFNKILLNGLQFYIAQLEQLEQINRYNLHKGLINSELLLLKELGESCNNLEVRDYVLKYYNLFTAFQPGNQFPEIELIDLEGDKFNWRKTKGKVVLIMFDYDYDLDHYFLDDLYKEYGYNKKDVIVLRISPGISHQNWKAYHIRYSEENYQMYFPGGEGAYLDLFEGTPIMLILDRSGHVVKDADFNNVRARIQSAQNLPVSAKRTFWETQFARIFPGAFLGMILTLFLTRLIRRRRNRKYELVRKMSDLEQKALKAQLNPHFLFNTLNSIQQLINTNKGKEAGDFLSVFARLVRLILDSSDREFITVSEEMEILKLYLDLEQLRFGFDALIEVDPEIDIYNTMIPTMMIQPLVENAIFHGLSEKEGEKKLNIKVFMEKKDIHIVVEDNGTGRKASTIEREEGRGLSIIGKRIELMNQVEPGAHSLRITDKTDTEGNSLGTIVEIVLPDET